MMKKIEGKFRILISTLLYAKCSGPFFTVSFNEDCRKQLEPFRIFIDEKFGVGPRGNKDPFCRFRKNHADSGPTIEFNAGQVSDIKRLKSYR